MATSPARRRPPGSTDVARLAGVSQKTVSRVLNGEPYVSAAIRQRVLEAAAELGYRRNQAARSLNSGRTYRLGVVSLGTALYGPATLLVAIERSARPLGYGLAVVTTDEGEERGVAAAVETLLQQGVDGIVVSEPIDEGPVHLDTDVPVVVMGPAQGITAPTLLPVGFGAEPAAAAVVQHLLDLGHATVHHLAGPQKWFSARERATGWRAALEAAGRAVPDLVEGDWSAASGHALGARLAADRGVTAVFAANDEMAIGLVRALREAGRRVPEDVSVVGYDDIPVAEYVLPALTTVAQDFAGLARAGLAALIRALDDGERDGPDDGDGGPTVPELGLVVRASTAPPPA